MVVLLGEIFLIVLCNLVVPGNLLIVFSGRRERPSGYGSLPLRRQLSGLRVDGMDGNLVIVLQGNVHVLRHRFLLPNLRFIPGIARRLSFNMRAGTPHKRCH